MRLRPSSGLLLLLLVFAAVISSASALAISLHPFAEMHGGLLEPIRYCCRVLDEGELRATLATVSVIGVVILHVFFGCRAWRRGGQRLRQLEDLLSLLPEAELSFDFVHLVRRVGLCNELRVVDSPEPFAFTAGRLKSNIYISTAAVHALDEGELEAVLRHEKRHQRARDPLRIQLIGVLRAAIGYLPATQRLSELFLRDREYQADDYALQEMGRVRPLLTAFVKLGAMSLAEPVAAGYGGFASDRINRLLCDHYARPVGQISLIGPAFISVVMVAALPTLALLITEPDLLSILNPL